MNSVNGLTVHPLPLRFVHAIPLGGVSLKHHGASITVNFEGSQPCQVQLRSNNEGDISLPLARMAKVSLTFDYEGTKPLTLRLRTRGSGWLGSHRELFENHLLAPGKSQTIHFDVRDFMLGQNEIHADRLDIDWISPHAGEITLHAIMLTEQTVEEFFAPRVDRFGQHLHGQWSGKLHHEEDLKTDCDHERLHEPPAERDEYGAWPQGNPARPTGFFQRAIDNEVHWLIAPNGHPFLSFGPTCVSSGIANTLVRGREHLFAELPPKEPPFDQSWTALSALRIADVELRPGHAYATTDKSVVSFYRANLIRKYGADWFNAWAEKTRQRLIGWGMNTCANWSDVQLIKRIKLPYVLPADRVSKVPVKALFCEHDAYFPLRQTPDVFHPDFEPLLGESYHELAEFADDPCLIGYFVQNEEKWYAWQSPFALPFAWESRRVFFQGLRKHYTCIEDLNTAWGTRFPSYEALENYRAAENPPGLSPQGRDDCDAFLEKFADRYFGAVKQALRAADPNHLYLGCRFLAMPPAAPLLKAAGRHMDVCSINWYIWHWQTMEDIPAFLGEWHRLVGKPLMITEYSFDLTDERGLVGRWLNPDPAERAKQAADFTRRCLALPFVVGCHWFQYVDQLCSGREQDGERLGLGLVDVVDRPYPELTETLREVGQSLYTNHTSNH